MNLKTYRAPSMAQALSEVKKDLGKDAVILHTRMYKVGAVMGIGGRQVIEVTAADQMSARGPGIRQERRPAAAAVETRADPFVAESFSRIELLERSQGGASDGPTVSVRPMKIEDLGPRSRAPRPAPAAVPPATERPAAPAPEPVAPAAKVALPTTKVTFAPADGEAVANLQTELASIKRLMGQVLQCSRQTAASVSISTGAASLSGATDPLLTLYLRLQDAQVAPAICDELIGQVRDELTSDELRSPDIARQAVLRHLAAMLPVVGQMSRAGQGEGGRPLTIALVGPTGVGKTTTIAKLAAAYKLRQGKKVGLITSDTYRIAAVDQLRTYANIIGLPLKVVLTPREMAAACSSLSDCDVVLIDTAGRSQHDAGRIEELGSFIEASTPDETHLLMSATVAEPVLAKSAERFARLRPTRVIFSKLDEAVHFGVMVNVLRGLKLKVSYVTTGQEVPDQIELAQADRMARLVLDGELVR